MILAVASGKGGTGKTTVATSVALALAGLGQVVSFLDCDVEAPNAHLFLKPTIEQSLDAHVLVPQVEKDACNACGQCAEACQYHAIVVLGEKLLVFPELCHGCGSCALVCPENAIREVPKVIGRLEAALTPSGIQFGSGLLTIGEPMATPVIRQLKKWRSHQPVDIEILDAPPGASCPVVESLRGADFVLLVTEPTPFGLHDLRLAVQLTWELTIPCGVIVNRDGIGDTNVDLYCQEIGIPILMRIAFEREIGAGIARGRPLVEIHPQYNAKFQEIARQIEILVKRSEVPA